MKKKILLLSLICITVNLPAQINLNKLKDKAKDKIEDKAKDKTDGNKGSSNTTNPVNTNTQNKNNTTVDKVKENANLHDRSSELAELNKKEKRERYFTHTDGKNMYDNSYFHSDEGINSDFHKNNIGKVVFSSQPIDAAGPVTQVSTSFSSDDNLYALAFFETAIVNYKVYNNKDLADTKAYYNETGDIIIVAYVDNEPIQLAKSNMYGNDRAKTYLPIAINGTATKENNADLVSALTYTTIGKHTVRIEVWPRHSFGYTPDSPAAMGEFTYEQKKNTLTYTSADVNYYTKDEGINSDLHKNNIGKIVFGKKRIDANGGTEQLVTQFNLGDNIYGRAFMSTCMSNYKTFLEGFQDAHKNDEGRFMVRVFIDNKDAGMLMQNTLSGEMENKTHFTVQVNGAGEDAEANNEYFFKTLNGLPDGSHTVRLEVWGGMTYSAVTKAPVAVGEFILIKKPGVTAKLGRAFNNVEAKMSNAELESKALARMNSHAKENGWKETFTKVKITDDDWSIIKNDLTGAVLYRAISITALAKWPDGHCTIQDFTITQDYNGSGYQNSVKLGGIGSQDEVDCN
ncbi:MAG TPA: hypothetical protein VD905_21975 [Flavobacteriales bacterium]|nr:hypothetical protein [Flavobacteriales bacterium]